MKINWKATDFRGQLRLVICSPVQRGSIGILEHFSLFSTRYSEEVERRSNVILVFCVDLIGHLVLSRAFWKHDMVSNRIEENYVFVKQRRWWFDVLDIDNSVKEIYVNLFSLLLVSCTVTTERMYPIWMDKRCMWLISWQFQLPASLQVTYLEPDSVFFKFWCLFLINVYFSDERIIIFISTGAGSMS